MPQMTVKRPYLWPAGPGGLVNPDRIIASGRWESAPMRRAARRAKQEGWLIDLTYGHAVQWVLFLDSGHIVLATEPMPVAVSDYEDPRQFQEKGWER